MTHRALALLATLLAACEPARSPDPGDSGRDRPGEVWCINVEKDLDCPDVDEASAELVGKDSCGTVVEQVLGRAYREDRGDHAGCCYDVVVTHGYDTCDGPPLARRRRPRPRPPGQARRGPRTG